jgi:serine/threonine protein kinase
VGVEVTPLSDEGDNMTAMAAKKAIHEVDRERCPRSGKSYVGVIDMLSPKVDVSPNEDCTFADLRSSSRAWAPPKPMERQGHPAHSLLAFDTVYEMQHSIGKGGFGSVYTAKRRRSGEIVAVKIIKAKGTYTEKDLREEADLVRKLDHPNIVRTVDAYWTTARDELRLVVEYAIGGELFAWCRARRRALNDTEHRRLAAELMRGLTYLHGACAYSYPVAAPIIVAAVRLSPLRPPLL